ncbi:MAG: U32 family peptidase [Ruminococcaceae bacterium]|nr:U32 family peptidase [Oscillospiraceae bacterium]
MSDMQKKPLPELLCPAGSPEALDAAIEGGADAVYLGAALFNARMNAHNFGGDALRSAVLRAHAYGVKVYLTLNTLISDRETEAFLETAREAARIGVDALIVADLGGASMIHRAIPTLELHASTQMAVHNTLAAPMIRELGFTRTVIARETPARDVAAAVKASSLEIEAFIHGALCVSHSGLCLFSSLVGGRSGNRGECAQPCRLPYSASGEQKPSYPLSLKDLSLAMHVPALIDAGVTSLKIEGRMKSPEYVRDTARIWRRLLDERRAATPKEMQELSAIFSRGGLTDGYWTERIGHKMLGIRSDSDKEASRTLTSFQGITRRIPLDLFAVMKRGEPTALTVSDGTDSVTVLGDIPEEARTAPLTRETLGRSLTKLGGTVYTARSFSALCDDGLMLPISRLNELRRRAIAAWETRKPQKEHTLLSYVPKKPTEARQPMRTACFYDASQIPDEARTYFDRIFLPLSKAEAGIDGVVLPPVIFDHEIPEIREQLHRARELGIRLALVGNLGHILLAKEYGFTLMGDLRLNVTNSETVAALESQGIQTCLLSPELTVPQARDIGGNTAITVYGRIPLMTLEKCVIREVADCDVCGKGQAKLCDRRGTSFPVLREWKHRNVIYNSLPTCMSDRLGVLRSAGLSAQHFIFSTETREEVARVIRAFREERALPFPVRRI